MASLTQNRNACVFLCTDDSMNAVSQEKENKNEIGKTHLFDLIRNASSVSNPVILFANSFTIPKYL